jgi:hypothetical protein
VAIAEKPIGCASVMAAKMGCSGDASPRRRGQERSLAQR